MHNQLQIEQEPFVATTISNLPDLLTKLEETPLEYFPKLLANLKIGAESFRDHKSWCNEHYKRNHIVKNDRYELILLCWEAGQTTPIHDHDGEKCWVYFVDGIFSETYYKMNNKMEIVGEKQMMPGSVSFMTDSSGFHTLKNTTKGRAMTLHLYANPIEQCRVFDNTNNSFFVKEMT